MLAAHCCLDFCDGPKIRHAPGRPFSRPDQGILETRLRDAGGWLAAGRYTIADIAHVGMVLLLKYILGEQLLVAKDAREGEVSIASWAVDGQDLNLQLAAVRASLPGRHAQRPWRDLFYFLQGCASRRTTPTLLPGWKRSWPDPP